MHADPYTPKTTPAPFTLNPNRKSQARGQTLNPKPQTCFILRQVVECASIAVQFVTLLFLGQLARRGVSVKCADMERCLYQLR